MSETAHDRFVRQVRYDRLHHANRLEYFRDVERCVADGWNRSDLHTLTVQSEEILRDPTGMHGLNSVDLEDTEHLAELDEWDAKRGQAV